MLTNHLHNRHIFLHQNAHIGLADVLQHPPRAIATQLLALLPENAHQRRKNEWLSSRLLLEEISGQKTENLLYTAEGKPFFPDGGKISISHSRHVAAVIWHPNLDVGIDVEEFRPQLLKVKEKFLSLPELDMLQPDDLRTLTAFWCAKEALYKWYGLKELQFNQHLLLQNLHITTQSADTLNASIDAMVVKNNLRLPATVHIRQFGNHILAYVIALVTDRQQ